MSSYLKVVRGLSKNVHLYNLAWFFIGFAIMGLANVLSNLYLLRLDYSPALIGQIQGVGQLSWAASALPASLLGMRFGMRKTLTAGTAIVGIFYILYISAAYLPGKFQIPMTFIALGLVFFGAALSLVCGLPYISSVTRPEERSTALALNGAVMAGAAVLGNLLAGLLPGWMATLSGTSLAQALPYRLSLAVIPLLILSAAIIQSQMQADHIAKTDTKIGASKAIPLGVFLFFGVVVFLQAASEGGLRAFFNIHLDHDLNVPTAVIGTIFSLSGLVSVFGALVMPFLVSRLGTGGTFGFLSIASAIFLVILAVFPNFLTVAVSFIILGLIFSIAGAVRNVLSQEIVQPYWRSATSGILIMGFALGWAVMALLGGWVISSYRFDGLMLAGAAVAVLAAILMFSYLAFTRRKSAAVVAEWQAGRA